MMTPNLTPEQQAREKIDKMLNASGWLIQNMDSLDFSAHFGIAVREYHTEAGFADYVLFINRNPVGVIEAKREEEGHYLTVVEEQSGDYAKSKLKYFENVPLRFVYESTGTITRFTDLKDPRPRSREVFTFHRPETLQAWLKEKETPASGFEKIPVLKKEELRDKTSLDIFWIKDDSLADMEKLPDPEELAEQIIENLEAGLAAFREIREGLNQTVQKIHQTSFPNDERGF